MILQVAIPVHPPPPKKTKNICMKGKNTESTWTLVHGANTDTFCDTVHIPTRLPTKQRATGAAGLQGTVGYRVQWGYRGQRGYRVRTMGYRVQWVTGYSGVTGGSGPQGH